MKLVTNKFKSGGLHEKHVVATWNLGNNLSICLQTQGNQEKPVSRWPVAGPSEYWLIASSTASKVKTSYRLYLFIYLFIVVCFNILFLLAEWLVNYELESMCKEAIVADFKVLSQDLSVCAEVRNENCLVRNSNIQKPQCWRHLAQRWHFAAPCSAVTFWVVNHVLCSSGHCCFCYVFQNENTQTNLK
jgi:hypothetical protein